MFRRDKDEFGVSIGRRVEGFGPAALCLLVLLTAILGALVPFTTLEDSNGLRWWYQFRGAQPPPQDVVIIALDSRSSRALNLPNRPDRWPRALHADLVRKLTAQGASAIVFDLLFDRPREQEGDQALAQAIGDSRRVLLGAYLARDQQPLEVGSAITLNTEQLLLPLPMLADAAYAVAPFPLPKTLAGMRDFWLFVPSAGDEATLPLYVAAMQRPEAYGLVAGRAGEKADSARLRQLHGRLPAALTFNLYGPPGTITTIAYDRALALLDDPADHTFRNRIVLVGFSEFNQPESRDAFVTAYSNVDGLELSGVELMATAVANLLHEDWLRRPSTLAWMGILALFGALLLLPWLWLSARTSLLLNLFTCAVYGALALWLFHLRLWMPLVAPLALQLPLIAGGGLLYRHRASTQRMSQLRATLNRYLPGIAIRNLLDQHRNPQGEVEVACLCVDVASYTALGESMSAPALRTWLNEYLEAAISVIARHGGHVVDLAGDGVLAIWAPRPDAGEACAGAVRAALELKDLRSGLQTPSRVGVHFGPVFFGDVGSDVHRALRAVGDTVNTTSRLQMATRQIGVSVLISADLVRHLSDAASIRRLGCLQLTGKQQMVDVYAPANEPIPAWEQVRVLGSK